MTDIEQKIPPTEYNPYLEAMRWQGFAQDFQAKLKTKELELQDFRQEVSDVVEQALSFGDVESLRRKGVLSRFVIPKPKPKPDPLAQTLGDFDGTLWGPEDVLRFRAALDARGFEIREKAQ